MTEIKNLIAIVALGAMTAGGEAISGEVTVPLTPGPPVFVPTSSIQIEAQTDCLNAEVIKRSLESVLAPYKEDASLLSVAVVEAKAVDGSAVTLRVMIQETGEIVLERRFSFNAADCIRAPQVLQLVLEQFLSGFPIAEWNRESSRREIPPPVVQTREVVVEKCPLAASWLVSLGILARFPSSSGAVEIGTGPDVGTKKHGFVGEAVARVGYPKSLESGRYLETFALMGMGWRGRISGRFQMNVVVRSGGLYVGGFGFDKNFSSWQLWVEARIVLAWRLRRSSIGIDLGGSPLQYTVSTADGEEYPLSFLHAGLYWSVPLLYFYKKIEELLSCREITIEGRRGVEGTGDDMVRLLRMQVVENGT